MSFFTIKTSDVKDGPCKITSRSDVTSCRPCKITSCFATSHPANHAICSYIDSSGYASGPHVKSEVSDTGQNLWHLYFLKSLKNRGSYMSARVFIDVLNRLRKGDKMGGLQSILFFFPQLV